MSGRYASERRPDPRTALLWVAAALLASAVAGTAVYKAWPLLYPKTGERAPLNAACDIRRGPCTTRFADGGSVTLEIRPMGIPVAKPLSFIVDLVDLPPPERMELDFAGVDMDMGFNRSSLQPADDGHTYVGSGMLPICVRDRMTWEARVLLYEADGIRAAPFRFETRRSGG